MKKTLLTIIAIFTAIALVFAEEESQKKEIEIAPSFAWQIEDPLGLRYPTSIDTLPDNYAQQSVPGCVSEAYATTGNMGAQGKNMIWMDNQPVSDFFFRDGIEHWLPTLSKMKFYNTRIPMTLMSYNTAGGRDNAQDRLGVTFSGNINSRAQIGALVDYLYSKGSYANQSTKDLIWGFSGSYIGDRYEFQGFYNHYNMLNKENGGITDSLYILDPALVQGGVSKVDPRTIPTNLVDAHTRISGQQLYMNHRYKVGYWDEEYEGDSVVSRTYIPVTSFIWTLNFNESKHMFRDESKGDMTSFFENTYLNPNLTIDRTSYWSLKNTFGVSLLEGFHKYAKFGLAAYFNYEIERYNQTADTLDRAGLVLTPMPENFAIEPEATEHNTSIGAQLTKQQGAILTYNAIAEFGITGRKSGDIKLEGNITTRFPLLGDTIMFNAFGKFTNSAAPYFMNKYISNHFVWDNDFGKTRNVSFGGCLGLPHSGTALEVEVSNVENHLYFNSHYLPTQHNGSVQVFSARLHQNIRAGILHWDNRITYQTSSNQSVISLPELAIYSNLYLKFKIATLFVQFGVDCNYYTNYYAPKYQPATATFANQNQIKFGNYPLMNAYANLKLSKARFYVLFSHVNQGWFSKNYFSMADYPLNPRRFQIGVSVDFAN